MKKLAILAFVAALSFINVSHANDINGDGNINISDVICIINIVLESGGGGNISQADAARFLNQTSFGATLNEINALVVSGSREAWLDTQLAMAATNISPKLEAIWVNSCPSDGNGGYYTSKDQVNDLDMAEDLRAAPWWDTVLNSDDQLRQRVAFALSEIFVVSSIGPNNHSSIPKNCKQRDGFLHFYAVNIT
jgi:hypothetical protein